MKRLVFLVEGDTEVILINQHIIPYLYSKGFRNSMHSQKIITNKKLHKKGGNVNYDFLKNDVKRVLAQGNVIITTFLDYFRLPTSFPGYTNDVNRIDEIENKIHQDLGGLPIIIPYIQKHEMEALMYCCIDGFDIVVDNEGKLKELQNIIDTYNNPEDINNGPETSPSKRLKRIFGYNKVADGELILEAIGIETMKAKCPRFANWLRTLELVLRN